MCVWVRARANACVREQNTFVTQCTQLAIASASCNKTVHQYTLHTHTHTRNFSPHFLRESIHNAHYRYTLSHTTTHTHHIANLCTVQTPSIICTLYLLLSLTFLHHWINDFNPIASLFLLFLFSSHKLRSTFLPIIISGKINVQL